MVSIVKERPKWNFRWICIIISHGGNDYFWCTDFTIEEASYQLWQNSSSQSHWKKGWLGKIQNYSLPLKKYKLKRGGNYQGVKQSMVNH